MSHNHNQYTSECFSRTATAPMKKVIRVLFFMACCAEIYLNYMGTTPRTHIFRVIPTPYKETDTEPLVSEDDRDLVTIWHNRMHEYLFGPHKLRRQLELESSGAIASEHSGAATSQHLRAPKSSMLRHN